MLETILIILFTVIYIWVAWWKLDWAIALSIVFLPTYLVRFQVWFVPMTVLEVMIIVIFLVWLVKLFRRGRNVEKAVWPWKWLTIFFVLSGIAAVLISPDTRQALGLWKAYILEPILFFIVFVNVIKTKQQVKMIFWAFGALTVMVGFIAMLQYVDLLEIPVHYGLESPPRATSVFPFPTAVGKLVGPLVALFLGLWLVNGKMISQTLWDTVRNNLFMVGVLLFGFIGLMFSVSRGALISVFIALVFISFFSRYKKWLWGVLIAIVLVAMLIPGFRNNITGVFKATDVSTDVRLVMWQGAVRIIKDNPIAGTGLASFPVVYEDYKEASHTEYFPNPDHFILSIWIEMGLAGIVLFAWLIIKYIKISINLLRKYKKYAVSLLAAMIALLAYGFLDTPYFKNDLAIAFWALVGLVVVLNRLKQTEPSV